MYELLEITILFFKSLFCIMRSIIFLRSSSSPLTAKFSFVFMTSGMPPMDVDMTHTSHIAASAMVVPVSFAMLG